ncbi:hypothetical protein [Acidocella sp.]|uniref:hypothetical protein n=1 Tax=Acidocella sp. TaxID=50710 RepID=UPI001855CB23|nr:hypothetical protein [Acidocella sp.]NNM58052.1 hypothetical protein [Acidocella sp.]
MTQKKALNWGFGVALTCFLAGLPLSWTGNQIELGHILMWLSVAVLITSGAVFAFENFWKAEMTEEKSGAISGGNVGVNSGTIHYHAPVYVAAIPNSNLAQRDPDGIYQHGQIVATVQGANVNVAHGTITFQTIRSTTGTANPDIECEYRDWVIMCPDLPRPRPNVNAATFALMVLGGSATIIRQRT